MRISLDHDFHTSYLLRAEYSINTHMMKVLACYLWLPILIGGFLVSFDLKYDLVGATFIILIAQSMLGLSFTLSRCVNLLSIYFIFTLVFFNLMPWLHYSTNHFIWRSTPILDSTYLVVNMVILVANIVLFIVYVTCTKSNVPNFHSMTAVKNKTTTNLILISLSFLSFSLLFYMNDFSILQLLFRGLVDEQREVVIESSSLALLLGLTARLIPVFCFFYAVTQLKGKGAVKLLLFTLMILSVFPTGVARYMAAFAYIPLVLMFIPAMRNASVFSALLLFSLVFVFPFLDQFRYFAGFENLRFLPSAEFFFAAHFDAYENFASAVESNFVSYGYQLMGALLFFVPRVFWSDKPVGSGYEMAEQLGYVFNNISMPFLGEGYVNFGFTGVVLFACLIGYLMAKADGVFTSVSKTGGKVNYSMVTYYFMLGALFFLLRGDLLSSFAYIVAGLTVALFVARVMKFTNSMAVRL